MTRRAAQAITAILDKTEHSPGQPFRLVAHPDGKLSLTLDSVTEDDATFEEDGLVFLVTETPLHPSLQGSTLDTGETQDGAAIVLWR